VKEESGRTVKTPVGYPPGEAPGGVAEYPENFLGKQKPTSETESQGAAIEHDALRARLRCAAGEHDALRARAAVRRGRTRRAAGACCGAPRPNTTRCGRVLRCAAGEHDAL